MTCITNPKVKMDRVSKLALGGGLGFAYSLVLAFLGGLLAGAGHGSYWFGMYALSPLGIGFYMWPVIGMLLAKPASAVIRWVIIVSLIAHYAGLVQFLLSDRNDWSIFVSTWKTLPEFAVTSCLVYLVGQLLIWKTILHRKELVDA